MNNKPNIPDEMILVHRDFSWRTTWTVNRWIFLVMIVSFICDVILDQAHKHWSLGLRLGILITDLLGVLLWARSLTRWISGMDELQRRISLTMVLFAVSATFFFFFLWLRLEREGFFDAVFGPPFMNNTWGIYTLFHIFVLVSGFYGIGYLIFNRRYK